MKHFSQFLVNYFFALSYVLSDINMFLLLKVYLVPAPVQILCLVQKAHMPTNKTCPRSQPDTGMH